MRILAKILCFGLLMGCGLGYEFTEVYLQKVDLSDHSLMIFHAQSNMNDGSRVGTKLLRRNSSTAVVANNNLPFGFVLGIPSKDTIHYLELVDYPTDTPTFLSTQFLNIENRVIKVHQYGYSNGHAARIRGKFASFRETPDSLILRGIEYEHIYGTFHFNEFSILKGNIKLVESDSVDGNLKRIEIPVFFLRKLPKGPIAQMGIVNEDPNQQEELAYLSLEPTRRTKTSEFSDRGIYKRSPIPNKMSFP